MSGFEDNTQDIIIAPPAPDFQKNLAAYQAQVEDIGVQIKAGQAQLTDINNQIESAKVTLQAQYNQKVSDLGGEIETLKAHIAALHDVADQWLDNIKERQAQHDAIVLDFSTQQQMLDSSWVDFHKNIDIYNSNINQLALDQKKLASDSAQLESDIKTFNEYKEAQTAILNEHEANINKSQANLDAQFADLYDQKNGVKIQLDSIATKQKELDDKTATAVALIAQADEINKQKAQNIIDAANNSKLALVNEDDARQIRVQKVALNNQQQSVAAREQAVLQAEKKIGG